MPAPVIPRERVNLIDDHRPERCEELSVFHALRHSFTSALANPGVPAEVRMKLTGHKRASSHQTYTHLELDNLRAAPDKLPSLVDSTKFTR